GCPSHKFVRICRRVLIRLGCLAPKAVQHISLPLWAECQCDTRVIYPSPCKPAPNVTMSSDRSVVRDRHFWIPLGGQLRELSAVHESAAMYFGMGHKSS